LYRENGRRANRAARQSGRRQSPARPTILTSHPRYWKAEISGATTYATYLFLQRDAKLTFLGWATMDLVEGTLAVGGVD
jgi:hypothetical protein